MMYLTGELDELVALVAVDLGSDVDAVRFLCDLAHRPHLHCVCESLNIL
jgi:hypothetical protein